MLPKMWSFLLSTALYMFTPVTPSTACKGGVCSALVHYPISGTSHYAEFNVPDLPQDVANCYYIYYNIDWQPAGPPAVKHAMNQFAPQLMLGNALDASSGAPLYTPRWHQHNSWVFSAQYFFEIFNTTSNKTEPHAATGAIYPCQPNETLYTTFELSDDWVWTLTMGVQGDPSRTSVVVVEQPFMGLLPSQTQSWSEAVYAKAWSNTCWELYGITHATQYPIDDMRYLINITTNKSNSIPWSNWTSTSQATCPGHPIATTHTTHTSTTQTIAWNVTHAERIPSGTAAPTNAYTAGKNSRAGAEANHPFFRDAAAPTCTTQSNIEYLGNNIVAPFVVPNKDDCCNQCYQHPLCQFYTYYEQENNHPNTCSLKNENAPDTSQPNSSCISGYPGSSPPAPPVPTQINVTVTPGLLVSTTSPSYVCWNIDASANRGFFWRNLSTQTSLGYTLAENARLLGQVQEGGHSILRFGGSGNDYVTYAFGDTTCPHPLSDYKQCINQTLWMDFLNFVNASNAKFIFGLSLNTGHDMNSMKDADTFSSSTTTTTTNPFPFPWNSTNAREILTWTIKQGFGPLIHGFELGNEQNTQYTGAQSAADLNVLHQLIVELWPQDKDPKHPRPVLYGPDPHSLHDANMKGPTGSELKWVGDWLDACHALNLPIRGVTHHEYIEVDPSPEGFTSPDRFALTGDIAKTVVQQVRQHDPDVEIWVGEIGPHNGGNPVCDHTMMRWANFGDSLWYMDAMASKAAHGYSGFCRQDYIGGDYGMMDCLTGAPLPDYWSAVLFGKLMGARVLQANMNTANATSVTAYAHCTNRKESGRVPGDVTLLLINLSDNGTDMHVPFPVKKIYVLESSGVPGLTNATGLMGSGVRVNGKLVHTMEDVKEKIVKGRVVALPKHSIVFVVVGANHGACLV